MNNSDFPNVKEDLQDFLTHPQHWHGTDVLLRKDNALSVLHYNPLLDRYYWYVMPHSKTLDGFKGSRLGRHELCTQLVEEGWVLEE